MKTGIIILIIVVVAFVVFAALNGWRKKVFGEEALALKHGKLALTAKGKSIKIISLE